tara:strand:- start:3552 stop:4538 length:987 start_codon:yes stop_codon:yes gene_type:complete
MTISLNLETRSPNYQIAIKTTKEKINEKLRNAIRDNSSLTIVSNLLNAGADSNVICYDGRIALHTTIKRGNRAIIKELVKAKADIEVIDSDGYTALHLAVKSSQADIVELLINQGASINATSKDRLTPLMLASYYGNIELAKLLLKANANTNATSKDGLTPLHWLAYKEDNAELAKLLLANGAGVSVKNNDGDTALHYAAKRDRIGFVKILLNHGENINVKNNVSNTALHIAIQEGHTKLAIFLIKPKTEIDETEIDAEDEKGMTPLCYAIKKLQRNKDLIILLLQKGANPNITNEEGKPLFHRIIYKKDPDIIEAFVKYGGDILSIF